ncbi:MAG: hypothetical protein A2W74_00375 [Planctomycetes bacterium RIFCSPLOWO2_12_38_17]|nr:MAG: hypothetical protein A3C31_02480 [Candidatus Roizmanbacteria bacterium RIFCSPHIGHO2_02_FULL_40_53]OHB97957.1 MAG: hypothetical protein A2W74_00375 [Planctomycetes bacterium RIFCSPLOWO2_12_38_17]
MLLTKTIAQMGLFYARIDSGRAVWSNGVNFIGGSFKRSFLQKAPLFVNERPLDGGFQGLPLFTSIQGLFSSQPQPSSKIRATTPLFNSEAETLKKILEEVGVDYAD